jgi:phosphogluconate dehydratase
VLEVKVDPAELAARAAVPDPRKGEQGYGRELFAHMRRAAGPAELGGGVFFQ